MAEFRNTQPSKEEYPDLKGQLNVQVSEETRAVIGGGRVSFMNEDYDSISISEWELSVLVETWTNARRAQKEAENEPGPVYGEHE